MAPKRAAPTKLSARSKRAAPRRKRAAPTKLSEEYQSGEEEDVPDSPLTAAGRNKKAQQIGASSSKADHSSKAGSDSNSSSGDSEPEEPAATKEKTAPPPTTAAPKNTAPPPAASDEEEEEAEVNKVTSPSTTKQPGLEAPDLEEGEEADVEEATEGNLENLPASSNYKQLIVRKWSDADSLRILEALAARRREDGKLLELEELQAVLADSLDRSDCSYDELKGKLKNLKATYNRHLKKGLRLRSDHDHKVFNLSKEVWGRNDTPANPRDFGDMCELYPNLGERMKEIEKMYPLLFKSHFGMMGDEKAAALDAKVKKLRLRQSKEWFKLDQELSKELTDLMDK